MDFFGAGLPVVAAGFACIEELVRPGKNGLVFDSSVMLSRQLLDLISEPVKLEQLARGAALFGDVRWDDHWKERAEAVMIQDPDGASAPHWVSRSIFLGVFAIVSVLLLVYLP